jgi:hypothetical protein
MAMVYHFEIYHDRDRLLVSRADFYSMSYDNLSSVSQNVLKFYHQLPVKRGGSLSFLTIFTFAVPMIGIGCWYLVQCNSYITSITVSTAH